MPPPGTLAWLTGRPGGRVGPMSKGVTTSPVDGPAIESAADRLIGASRAGRPCLPVRGLIGADDVASAYAVQQRVTSARLRAGGVTVGRKIGLTSLAVQQQLGVHQPDFGVLFADMQYHHGDVVPTGRFLQPRVEAEIAFVLGADLSEGDLNPDRVRAAIAYAVGALEICDSRIAGWDISIADTVADNASSGAYVLGTQRRKLSEFIPQDVTMHLSISDQEPSTGSGAACLGDPLKAVEWLARQAHAVGDPLRAGEVVLSGALGPMRPVSAGDQVRAQISGLGDVAVQFTDEGDRT